VRNARTLLVVMDQKMNAGELGVGASPQQSCKFGSYHPHESHI